jgi:dCTP deaminase
MLVDYQIRKYIEQGTVVVEPYNRNLVKTSSLDVRAGRFFTTTKLAPGYEYVDPTDSNSFENETYELDEYVIAPGGSVMVSLMEDITLPNFISVKLFGKSSMARLGIENSPSAMFAEAGWSGILTCELYNFSKLPVVIREGMPIGQLVFFEHQQAEKPYKGRYLRQAPGSGSKSVQ